MATQTPADRKQVCYQLMATHGVGVFICAAALWAVSACATTGLTRQDVLREYDSISKLESGLSTAQGQGAALLAPETYKKTKGLLNEAVEQAREGDTNEARVAAQRGLESLQRLEAAMDQSRRDLDEVLTTRQRARNEGAPGLFSDEFENADEVFKETARLIEEGKRDEALRRRPMLVNTYADLELKALKKGTVEAAKQAVAYADKKGADDLAPATYEAAKQELAMVTTVLEADRTQTEKAEKHAKNAIWLAQRSIEVADMVRMFDEEDYSLEGIVLWYQNQLADIHKPLQGNLPFDQSNAAVVQSMREDIESLLSTISDMRETQKENQQQIAYLESELNNQEKQHQQQIAGIFEDQRQQLLKLQSGGRAELNAAQREAQDRIAQLQKKMQEEAKRIEDKERRIEAVRALFRPNDADVLLQGDEIIVRLHGFNFDPGTAYVDAKNFSMLNHVVSAVNKFPEAEIIISGHTDSMGSDDKNMMLSLERAENVARYLESTAGLDSKKIDYKGFGETQPVASNDTSEGRAKNRRIEVRILPNWEALSPETQIVQQRTEGQQK